jgi:hypothetical protein
VLGQLRFNAGAQGPHGLQQGGLAAAGKTVEGRGHALAEDHGPARVFAYLAHVHALVPALGRVQGRQHARQIRIGLEQFFEGFVPAVERGQGLFASGPRRGAAQKSAQ